MHCPHIRQGLRINHDGNMVPCCDFDGVSPFFIDKNSIIEYENSVWISEIEKTLSNNEWPAVCKQCQLKEESSLRSTRLQILNGKVIEIVVGNVCNSDCGMCGPNRSSKIASRLRYSPIPKGMIDYQDDSFLIGTDAETSLEIVKDNNFIDLLLTADTIKLIGGEPFISKSIWKTLDSISKKNNNIKVELMTNASQLDEHHISVLSRFNNLEISFSAEATTSHYEWIRYGLKWNKFCEVMTKLNQYAKYSYIAVTVNALSITSIKAIVEFADSQDIDINIWPVTNPKLLSLVNVNRYIILDAISDLVGLNLKSKKNKVFVKSFIAYLNKIIIDCRDQNDQRLESYVSYLNNLRTTALDPKKLKIL